MKTTASTARPNPPRRFPGSVSAGYAGPLLVAAVCAAYANTLSAPFVYDDGPAILENLSIRRLWPLTDIVLPQAEGGLTVSGRPVLNLSFAINYAISGTAVWSYHAANILIHAASALLLFGLVRRTLEIFRDKHGDSTGNKATAHAALAFAISGLWALHPLQTQAVTYTVQRAESLMGLFYLLTLYAFARAVGNSTDTPATPGLGRRSWFSLTVLACALGMGTKEVMVTAPLLVLLFDRTFVAGSFRDALGQRRSFYLALAATWLLLGALVLSTGGNRGGTVGLGVGVPLWAYPLTQFQAVARYLGLAFWPHPLVFEYGTFWVERAADIAPFAAAVLPLLVATGYGLWRRPVLGFFGTWFFLILAPTSLAPGTIQMIVEHRMYLPLAAVITLVVLGMHPRLGHRAYYLFLLTAIVCGVLTVNRNHDYRSRLALWSTTVAQRPENPRAREGLAEAYAELGRLDEAIAQHAESVRLLPDEATYRYNLALALSRADRAEEAVIHYRHALRLNPREAKTHNNLAIALGRIGQGAAALPHYAEAEHLNPQEPQFAYNHGIALFRLGRTAEAISRYEAALRLRPTYADAHFNLASALATSGRLREAVEHYRQAVAGRPTDAEYRTTLAGALLISGDASAALTEYRAVLATHPDHAPAHFGLGNALAATRQFAGAIVAYEAALRINPDNANAHFKLGNALIESDQVSAALMHYESAVRLNSADAEAHHNLGIAYARLDRFAEAGQSFEAALRIKPDYTAAQRHLAQVRALLRR